MIANYYQIQLIADSTQKASLITNILPLSSEARMKCAWKKYSTHAKCLWNTCTN